MMKQTYPLLCVLALLTAIITISLISGCGGGGGGGGSNNNSSNGTATISGALSIDSSTPAVGYHVFLVSDTSITTVTKSNGQFSLSFDASKYNGSVVVRITDTNNNTIDNEAVTVSSSGGAYSLGSIDIGPPTPPV